MRQWRIPILNVLCVGLKAMNWVSGWEQAEGSIGEREGGLRAVKDLLHQTPQSMGENAEKEKKRGLERILRTS